MRVTIDDYTQLTIDEILDACRECEDVEKCGNPYKSRKEVLRAALQKFGEMDCTPDAFLER